MNSLNTEQYLAARAEEGAFLIIAGAGSGKTRTLVYRVSRLIELGFDPQSILLLTFTRKAASEMMSRAEKLLDSRCSKIQGGTFHSFANLVLRKYGKSAGINSNFTILDQGDSEDVVNLIRGNTNFIDDKKRFPNKSTLFKIYSFSVNSGKKIEDIVEEEYPHFALDIDKIIEIHRLYNDYKNTNNLFDYDDLLLKLRDFLFDFSPAAKSLLQKINFVMVDEYQDTNKIQAEIVQGLTQIRKNVMVVGDDLQSIYSFRGANFQNILDFPKLFPGCEIIKLEKNYRSTKQILTLANKIQDAAIYKFEKTLYSDNENGELPVIVCAEDESFQSKYIVNKILELREEGVKLKEIAVLFRSSYFSFNLEIELAKANIPYIKVGGMKFVESAHIKDVLAFLRVAVNVSDAISWYRILMMHEGIGPRSAQKILTEMSDRKFNFETIAKDNNLLINKKLPDLFKLIYNLHNKNNRPIDKVSHTISYYTPFFKNLYDDFNKRNKDLEILANLSEKYEHLDDMISDMAIEPPIDSAVDAALQDNETEFLTLSTIHSAKGLEWHTVFIIHLMDGFFPSVRSIDSTENLEEERRLMYVAATRAKQNLFLSYPMTIFDREAGHSYSKPSRFLNGIKSNIAESVLVDYKSLLGY